MLKHRSYYLARLLTTLAQTEPNMCTVFSLFCNSNETNLDNDERDPGRLDAKITQLLNSDTKDVEFDGFVVEE